MAAAHLPDGSNPGGPLMSVGAIFRTGRLVGDDDLKRLAGLRGDLDPLALRLALILMPYGQPAHLSAPTMHKADDLLRRWRRQVARWAQAPSRPPPAHLVGAARAALDHDLDTRRVVETLRRSESDAAAPDGAKFETFAYLDRVLGLELVRTSGAPLRVRRWPHPTGCPRGLTGCHVRRGQAQ
ncbi:MAG TPA: hypothetical protein VNG13_08260 [Mycobacteriales bacterium]|nr:hypothetical protein [Mycobacteriales bacterium]